MQAFNDEWEGGEVITEMDFHSLQWTFCALHGGGRSGRDRNFPNAPDTLLDETRDWINHMSGLPQPSVDARIAIECRDVLMEKVTLSSGAEDLYTEAFRRAVTQFKYREEMFQFCDVPTAKGLAFDIPINQLCYPMHYSVDATKRWTYTAQQTQMMLDVILLDECRYVYEWLPTIDLLREGFVDKGQQLSYRFALDG